MLEDADAAFSAEESDSGASVSTSMFFGAVAGTIRSIYIPGRWISFGSRVPRGTMFSAYKRNMNKWF